MDSTPQAPTTPCTLTAPTGSSILTLSKKRTEKTTITPPTAPITTDIIGVTAPHGPVMATRPARAPLPIMATSGLPLLIQIVMVVSRAPAAAASIVLTAMVDTNSSASSSEPGLNPNQPTQRMNTPSVANGML